MCEKPWPFRLHRRYTDPSPKYVVGKPVPPNLPLGQKHSFVRGAAPRTSSLHPVRWSCGGRTHARPGAAAGQEKVWFEVAPPLPQGLSMPFTTGVIGGTPLLPCKAQTHTVTATSRYSSASTAIKIEVLDRSRADELQAHESETDAIELITSPPAPGKVHISFTGPTPKGKEWMALGRVSAPSIFLTTGGDV